MSTSGTTSYTINANDLITASLQAVEVIAVEGETSPASIMNSCLRDLNGLIKFLMTKGLQLWKVQDQSIPMQASKLSYSLGPSGDLVTDRPLRVVSGLIRDANNNDMTLQQISRQEYQMLGYKQSPGIPNSFYYDPQIPNGVLYLYSVPTDTSRTVWLKVQKPIQDINSLTDNFDLPQEWYLPLKWVLAQEIGPNYGAPERALKRAEQRALYYLQNIEGWDQEEASTFFMPDTRGAGR